MAESSIEWTDATWNPVAGCAVISPGCTNCYAMRMAARLEAMGTAKYAHLTRKSGSRHVWTGSVFLDEKSLLVPMLWKKPKKIFVNSMSDLFHEDVPENFIDRVWNVMNDTPHHVYQILTKRSHRMKEVSARLKRLPNVWLGTSVESSEVLFRLDDLRETNAFVRFVSFEPLLSSVKAADLANLQWAIVGGESGPRARKMEPIWVDEIQMACNRDRVAFFFKQWGGTNKARAGRILNGRTYDEMPHLRI